MATGNTVRGYYLTLTIADSSTDPANNASTFLYELYLNATTNSFDTYSVHGTLYIDGVAVFDAASLGQITLYKVGYLRLTRGFITKTHSADGTASVFGEVRSSESFGTNVDAGYTPRDLYVSESAALTNFTRLPNAPAAAPTVSSKTGTSLTLTSAVSAPLSPVGPAISYEYHSRSSVDGTTWSAWTPVSDGGVAMATPPSGTSISGLSATTYYQFQTRASSTEGKSAWSATTNVYPVPAFQSVDGLGNITTLPDSGTFSLPFSGTVSATNATSITVSSGSLPPGLTTSSSTTGGTTTLTISGAPTSVGVYSFGFSATGPGGTTTLATAQSIAVGAAGPWVYSNDNPTGVNVTNVSVANFNTTYNLATLTTGTHGIIEKNQPITLSGISGTYSVLNGDQTVYSIPGATSLTILVAKTVTGSGAVTGMLKKYYSRAAVVVFQNGWNQQTGGGTQSFLRVKYADNRWLAHGAGANVYRSTDGITWASTTTPSTASYIMSMDYGPINGVNGWLGFNSNGEMLVSYDHGLSWSLTASIFGAGTYPVREVKYDNGIWVSVGEGGKIASSSDGINWTVRNSGVATVFYSVVYTGTRWLAVGVPASGSRVSFDGITWTAGPAMPFTPLIIERNLGRLIIANSSGSIASSDNDGVTWTTRYSSTLNFLGLSNFGNTWLAVGTTSPYAVSSTDNGTTWTVDSPSTAGSLAGVDFNGQGVAVAAGGSGRLFTYGLTAVPAIMRVYDPTYTDPSGGNWRPLS